MEEELHSRTGIFMTELILVILFFSIAAACCLQVFTAASQKSRQADELQLAVTCCDSLAEQLKENSGDLTALAQYETIKEQSGSWTIFYEKNGRSCEEAQAAFQARLTQDTQEGLPCVIISFQRLDGSEVYSLRTAVVTEVLKYETEE